MDWFSSTSSKIAPGGAVWGGINLRFTEVTRVGQARVRMQIRSSRRVRLCLKDLYHQDVVEMIERETRKYELWTVEDPSDPQFMPAYKLLWDAFGPEGEMEREEAIRKFVLDDPHEPTPNGTYF